MLVSNNRYLINLMILILSTILYHSSFNIINIENPHLLFNSYFSFDNITISIVIIASLISIWIITQYCNYVFSNRIKLLNNELIGLIILLIIALIGLSSSNSYLSLFVCIELQSLILYIILATKISSNSLNNYSKISLSYLINAALATAILLLGISLNNSILIIVSILWKLGIIPVHSWSLPILDNQHSLISAIYLTLAKYGILFIIGLISSNNGVSIELIQLIGLLNLILGNIIGLLQYRYQRILVYSGLIQIGYILLVISNYTELGITYFELYSLSTIILFILWSLPTYNQFNSARLLNKMKVWIMVITLFTVAGLPFFPLFWTKLDILLVISSSSLIIALISTFLSSLIYIRLIKYISFFN